MLQNNYIGVAKILKELKRLLTAFCLEPRFCAGIFLTAALLLAAGCGIHKDEEQFKIGFSQCGETDAWRRSMIEEMRRELAFHPGITLLYKEAQDDSRLQVQQVKELIDEDIDLLIISPNEAQPLTPIVEEAFDKGIRVIVVDRKIASTMYNNYIGANNYELGKMAGEYTGHLLNGKGRVIEITGLPTSSPATERNRGFIEAISQFPGIQITDRVNGAWTKAIAKKSLAPIEDKLDSADLIFAHNDVMALGAHEVCDSLGRKNIKIIGVDALPGKGAGMEMVGSRILTASMLYPTGGAESIRNAVRILNNQPVNKETILNTLVVDSANVRMMSLQTDKIISQQSDIKQQQGMLLEQKRIYNNQRTYIYILGSVLLLAICFAGLLFYSRLLNRRINRQLLLRNAEVQRKTEELIEMSEKANAAHEAKLNFFTNISHEFRTPLCLILAPVEELRQNQKLPSTTRHPLALIEKNAYRLLRLVNELIDFRKIEFKKMQIRAAETDLVLYVNDILQNFQSLAHKRNIDCRLLTTERILSVWIDESLFDKVLNNLLSNAFKFTDDGGSITVIIQKESATNNAVIRVEDNGTGMSEQELGQIFEPFFQGRDSRYSGSGLGLALTKELVDLHHGSIHVNSRKDKGTSFTILLPLGKEHFSENELSTGNIDGRSMQKEESWPDNMDDNELPAAGGTAAMPGQQTATILVVDDNAELRGFLKEQLTSHYFVMEAEDGVSGLQQVFDHNPDLVISDVMMPGKDGITFTEHLKKDIRTAHIPIILLTAKTSVEQQIEGLKSKADAYITKPFNLSLLQHTISNLLQSRAVLKDHLTMEIPLAIKGNSGKKSDRQFLAEFTAIVESNLSNDSFSVEDICKAMHLSKMQLYRKVKVLLDVSINEYILNARIQKAKYLIQHDDLNISDVAFQTGFSSASYFSTVFKNKTGQAPNAFRKKKA